MTGRPRLLFVYNARSGLVNALIDSAHKALSPETYACQLCQLTHGLIGEKTAWRDFLRSLQADTLFLHRDQLGEQPVPAAVTWPAVLYWDKEQWVRCLSAADLAGCRTTADLIGLVQSGCLALRTRGSPSDA